MTNSENDQLRVGVFGGSGYIGAELLRYLSVHPAVSLSWVTAYSKTGLEIGDVLPNLKGAVPGVFVSQEEGEQRISEVDVAFAALPHNESQRLVPRLAEANAEVRFIDMAGDFRTNDAPGYEKYYGCEHGAVDWLPRFTYGFTEFQRDKVSAARLVANPGCFATGMLLAVVATLADAFVHDPVLAFLFDDVDRWPAQLAALFANRLAAGSGLDEVFVPTDPDGVRRCAALWVGPHDPDDAEAAAAEAAGEGAPAARRGRAAAAATRLVVQFLMNPLRNLTLYRDPYLRC